MRILVLPTESTYSSQKRRTGKR
uniref:Uncharacterized protein n=1 Tax=Rhizophora mucronata TaxID=61149 RepID=A0A2P2R1Z2_RHIMU